MLCPRSRIQLLAEHKAAEKLREQQQRHFAPSHHISRDTVSHHISTTGPWILLTNGASVERVPKYSPKVTSYKVEGKPVIRYSG